LETAFRCVDTVEYHRAGAFVYARQALNMRMSQENTSAADIYNEIDEADIASIIYLYGEAGRLLRYQGNCRKPSTDDDLQLISIVAGCLPRANNQSRNPHSSVAHCGVLWKIWRVAEGLWRLNGRAETRRQARGCDLPFS
jgi:hypothetical protein